MAAGTDLIERGEIGDAAQVGDPARADDSAADVIDQLVLDQLARIPERVENFAHRQRRGGVLTHQLERLGVFRRGAILQPEQLVRLQHLAQIGGFLRGIAVVAIVEQMVIKAVSFAQFLEQLGHMVERLAGIPASHRRQRRISRFVEQLAPTHAVSILDPRHPGLGADRLVAHVDILTDRLDRLGNVCTVGMAIDHDPVTTASAKQLIERHPGHLGLDIPQRHINRGNRPHRHRSAAPVCAAIEILPDVLDAARVHADQAGDHVIREVGNDRKLAAIQRAIADTVDALIGFDLERNEITPRAGDDDAGSSYLHCEICPLLRNSQSA